MKGKKEVGGQAKEQGGRSDSDAQLNVLLLYVRRHAALPEHSAVNLLTWAPTKSITLAWQPCLHATVHSPSLLSGHCVLCQAGGRGKGWVREDWMSQRVGVPYLHVVHRPLLEVHRCHLVHQRRVGRQVVQLLLTVVAL